MTRRPLMDEFRKQQIAQQRAARGGVSGSPQDNAREDLGDEVMMAQ